MDPTLAAILGGFAGLTLGAMSVAGLRASERSQRRMASPPPPPPVPAGTSAVLAVLGSSTIVIDHAEHVLKVSPTAVADGLVKGDRVVHTPLLAMARQVHRDGVIREAEFELRRRPAGRPPAWVHARVAPLLENHILILVDDRTQARRVEEVRRDFVVNVSHELKTPVGGLSLLAEAMMGAKDDPEAIEMFAARMQLESARLGNLIKEIVDLSRIQSTDSLADARPLLLADVVREAIALSRVEADAKGVTIIERVDPDARVSGDLGLLVTALRNLIGNAIAYSGAGSEVGVGVRVVEDRAEVTVTDRGVGIPAAEQERIFERFYRVDSARSRATGGTGLGLAIVKHICANHGGTVAVWSQEGQGSTFTLDLPLAAASRPLPTPFPLPATTREGSPV